MILYHGSYLEIKEPDLTHSRSNVDFVSGFHVTPLYDQAAKWCGKSNGVGKTELISHLRYEKPNLQICFRTEKALELLHFEGSEMV